jgi:hypothetical protein
MAGALVVGGSVGVVVAVAEQLAGLYSLETRERVTELLAQPPGSDLGLSVPTALSSLRVVLMVLAGCATTSAILGWHALRGSVRARLGLAVLAVPIFLGGFAVGGFLTSLVAAGTVLMFAGPSALWFRGEPIPEPAKPPRAPERPPLPERRPGASARPGATLQAERPTTTPTTSTATGPVTRRPDSLVWACVLTWAFSALTVVVMVASAVLMASNPDLVVDELRSQGGLGGTDAAELAETVYVSTAVVGAWSLLATVLAVLAYRGVAWSRRALLASTVAAAVVCLLGAAYSLLMVLPAGATVATVALLNRPEVRAWFRHRSGAA